MLNNSQLSNNKIRQLSITPNPKSYQEFLDALYCDLDFAIAELAKYKNSGPTYTNKGLNQLAYRYSTGLEGQNAGGLLIYIDSTNLNQKKILDKWSESLQDSCFPIIKPNSPCANNSLAFYSTHTHPFSGLDYTIRHMTLDFRYSPKDKQITS